MTLSLPPDAVPLSKSYFELGGNSVSMVAAIVQLRQHSLYIDINQFSRATSIHEVICLVTSEAAPTEDVCRLSSDTYDIVPLSEVRSQGDLLIEMWAECYSRKNPLYTLLGVRKSDAISPSRDVFQAAVEVGSMQCMTCRPTITFVAILFNFLPLFIQRMTSCQWDVTCGAHQSF